MVFLGILPGWTAARVIVLPQDVNGVLEVNPVVVTIAGDTEQLVTTRAEYSRVSRISDKRNKPLDVCRVIVISGTFLQ